MEESFSSLKSKLLLIEDHNEALKIWREKGFKHLDLIHIDAHIDFGFHSAKPQEQIIKETQTLKQLKRELEKSLLYQRYHKDFDKQTNIGNYIYPAMREGIIKDFYWVVPGGLKEFKESLKLIKKMLKDFAQQDPYLLQKGGTENRGEREEGIIATKLLGRKFVICTLEKLPILKQNVLLDIDTDLLIIDSILNTGNTKNIGKRKPWISPEDLVRALKRRIKKPKFITIAYSVNGGYTPMRYKHLGDEVAYCFAPEKFRKHFDNNFKAAYYFNLFCSSNKKEYYQKAVELNPTYRVADNNYGLLYLSLRKFSLAQDEFLKVLRADPKNPACLLGLGNIALEKRDFKKAKEYFSSILTSRNHKLFTKVKNQSLFSLARAEFSLKNFKMAKELLVRYQAIEPLQAQSYYLLGYILEKEKDFVRSAQLYQDAIRLGLGSIELISRLLKISGHLKEKDAIIKYVVSKYKEFKRGFFKVKGLSLKRGSKIKGLRKIEEKMTGLERKLQRYATIKN